MKVFIYSLKDFFFERKILFFSLFLLFLIPRLFYGFFIYYHGDAAFYHFSLQEFGSFISSFIAIGEKIGLNDKKVIYLLSMFCTILIGVGIFRKGYLFSKSKRAATYTALLYFLHPLSAWFSGEPRLVQFSHSLFVGGIFLTLNQNKKLLWKNLLGLIFFIFAVKTDAALYSYTMLFFIFNILENAISKSHEKTTNNQISIGQAIVFLAYSFIFLGWNNIVPLSSKILSEINYVLNFFQDDSVSVIKILPDMFDEYFRSLMKSYFSPLLMIFPFMILAFGRELKISNYSRGLYSISLLVCSVFFLEFKNLTQSNYSQIYWAIILSILISSIGCQRLYHKFSYLSLKIFIMVFLPISLAIGLGARGYRDFFRQQSMVGIMDGIEKTMTETDQLIYLPFGQDLNAKQFIQYKIKHNLEIRKLPHLSKNNFSTILLNNKQAYLFIDDYFIFNYYWHGQFLKDIQTSLKLDHLLITKLFQTEGSRNRGYLFKLEWQN